MLTSDSKRSSFLEIVAYTIPKLYVGKCWYIGYTAFDPSTGTMKRQRIKLNHIEKITDRRKYAAGLIYRLTKQLENGWNPFIESENSKSYHTFKDVCLNYRTYTEKMYNGNNLREKTLYGYMSMLRTLENWNNSKKVPITYVYQFDRIFVTDFLNFIFMDRNNSIRTRNNYLTWLNVFNSYLVQNSYLKIKATEGILMIKRNTSQKDRDVIDDKDMLKLKEYLEKNNRYYQLASYLLFYVMIRPKEMSYLKLANFHLKKQTVFIPGEISKNKKSAVVTLPAKVIRLMVDLKIFDSPSSYYLFSDDFKPGPTRRSERYIRDYWDQHVRKDLNFPVRYKFYSLKDTGITSMLRDCEALSVRDQARHSSLLMTNTYTPQDIQDANDLLLNYDGIF